MSSRKIGTQTLFSIGNDFPKTLSLAENQFSGKTYFYTIASRVYTFSADDDEYRLFKLTDVTNRSDGYLVGREIHTQTWEPLHNCPDFTSVGIFRMRGYIGGPVRIQGPIV